MTPIAIRHGSHDSTDIDVVYVFDRKPGLLECHRFCAESEENRNIMVVRDGVVVECFKGLPDEVNNGVLRTYHLHTQAHPNPVLRPVERIVPLKIARGIRLILTRLTRTPHRTAIKAALRSHDFNHYRSCLADLDFRTLALGASPLKSIAFQLGQMHGLLDGAEHYTKTEIAGADEQLAPFLLRASEQGDLPALNESRDRLLAATAGLEVKVDGALNQFDAAGTGPEPLMRQCHGTLLDLDAERCVKLGGASQVTASRRYPSGSSNDLRSILAPDNTNDDEDGHGKTQTTAAGGQD